MAARSGPRSQGEARERAPKNNRKRTLITFDLK
jgi:hypothetical protein